MTSALQDTNTPPAKGSVLFFAVLLNALSAISEINSLYAQRPIVEKHKSYAFYHPATEVSLNGSSRRTSKTRQSRETVAAAYPN